MLPEQRRQLPEQPWDFSVSQILHSWFCRSGDFLSFTTQTRKSRSDFTKTNQISLTALYLLDC